jgi:SpoVK/Ycf46/Vps4 family AAA+-type ATPase
MLNKINKRNNRNNRNKINKNYYGPTPSMINNYNKFLTTIDSMSDLINIQKQKTINETIDSLIEKIDNKFINDNLDSVTGQSANDVVLTNLKINNPDIYLDDVDKKCFGEYCCCKIPNINKNSVKNNNFNKVVEIEKINIEKKLINIDVEINSIDDLLSLIEQYKIEPDIKYNINMLALHNIKEPLIELNNMIGMKELKNNIIDQILYFVQELNKGNNSGDFMHTVIYGPPGTGKTEIAKIMGKIYSKIGILTKGTFRKVIRSDLISGYLGQTALKTRDVIKDCLGGVLFIDEAYALGNNEKKDSFSKECIDTLCEGLSDNKNNLMVIIAGYENELKECFFNYNQGLDSRFTWRFSTDEYKADDLYKIFLKKVNDIEWTIDKESKINVEWFKKNMDYFKFFGRDMETLLAKTKITHSKRVFCKPENEKKKITLCDLNKGLDLYLKNNDVKNRKESENLKKSIQSIYI